jgi:hypothetical protein
MILNWLLISTVVLVFSCLIAHYIVKAILGSFLKHFEQLMAEVELEENQLPQDI